MVQKDLSIRAFRYINSPREKWHFFLGITRRFKARYARPMFINLLLIFLYLIISNIILITVQKIAMLFFFEIFEICDKISRRILGKRDIHAVENIEKGSESECNNSFSKLCLIKELWINISINY